MAHLTKPTKYNIEDSNIALLGSDLEKRIREEAGDGESAWNETGTELGIEIWRIEKFHVVAWPKERYGSFYDGDSYIILHTYKKTPDAKSFSYDLHFWLGENTSQDEAGTAAYKTVELDDHLSGKPVQSREVQGFESAQFLSYFPRFISLKGGIDTGFHHASVAPPPDIRKLYRISLSRHRDGWSNLVVREVPPTANSLVGGDVYVLDKGVKVLQFNSMGSAGQERFKAGEFVQSLVGERKGQCGVTVYDEGGSGEGVFLGEFGRGTALRRPDSPTKTLLPASLVLFRMSDESGVMVFQAMDTPSRQSLISQDVFLLDLSSRKDRPAVYVWIGQNASPTERRRSIHLAQQYLYDKREKTGSNFVRVAIPVVKIQESEEPLDFLDAF